MEPVTPKKKLGQHFLKDENIARKIAGSLSLEGYRHVLEVGPGMGVLTKYLLEKDDIAVHAVEIDKESIEYLSGKYPEFSKRLIEGDFLKLNFSKIFEEPFAVIGNFPYNISSQIIFKILENRNNIPEVVGMFQKEVAERFSAKTRTKSYGILSVFLQTFYKVEYLFTVGEQVFNPPPKVKSAVVRLTRKENFELACDERLFFDVVKTAFNQRRKTLSNALKKFNLKVEGEDKNQYAKLRAEELTEQDFIELTLLIQKSKNS